MKNIIFVCLLITQLVFLSACKDEEASVYFETETESKAVSEDDAGISEDMSDTSSDNSGSVENTDTVATSGDSICVYVCGQVTAPGVYELPSDSRVCDAIEKAGGMLESASQDYWNLAETLQDGQMIYVPTKEEAGTEGRRSRESEAGSIGNDSGIININTASESQLMTLTGIGQSKAKSIIEYRTQNGKFSSVDELTNVTGIGEAILNKIRDQITVY